VTLNALILTGGHEYVGAGIQDLGALTLNCSTVTGNRVTATSMASGGGIYNECSDTLNGAIQPPATGANVSGNTPDNPFNACWLFIFNAC
jgi:hypothetical protein